MSTMFVTILDIGGQRILNVGGQRSCEPQNALCMTIVEGGIFSCCSIFPARRLHLFLVLIIHSCARSGKIFLGSSDFVEEISKSTSLCLVWFYVQTSFKQPYWGSLHDASKEKMSAKPKMAILRCRLSTITIVDNILPFDRHPAASCAPEVLQNCMLIQPDFRDHYLDSSPAGVMYWKMCLLGIIKRNKSTFYFMVAGLLSHCVCVLQLE